MGPHHWLDSLPISQATLRKIKADARGHGQQPQNGGDGRQHHRPKPHETRLDESFPSGHAPLFKLVVIVDQNDGIVDHDTCQTDDADAGHDNAECGIRYQKPQEYTDEGKKNRRQNDEGGVKKELNWVTRIRKIINSAATKALLRNAADFACSSCSPEKR